MIINALIDSLVILTGLRWGWEGVKGSYLCKCYQDLRYICGMADVNLTYEDVISVGRKYGEEFDRSQVDKWLKGKNSSKAVRVMLAMMESELKVEAPVIREATGGKPVVMEEDLVVPAKIEEVMEVEEEEVELLLFKYEAPGARDSWRWDAAARTLHVCYREQVFTGRKYLEVGSLVSLEGDLVRLGLDGKLEAL